MQILNKVLAKKAFLFVLENVGFRGLTFPFINQKSAESAQALSRLLLRIWYLTMWFPLPMTVKYGVVRIEK